MSRPKNSIRNRKLAGIFLPTALLGSLFLPLEAQAQVNKDRTRPPQPSPAPAPAPAPAPRPSPPTPPPTPRPSPPPATPSRSSDSGGRSGGTPSPPAKSGGSGKGVDFDVLFGGGQSGSRTGETRPSQPGGRDVGKRPDTPAGSGTTATATQSGAAHDRFQRTREGAIYSTPPPAEVIFGRRYHDINPYYDPYRDYYPYPGTPPFPYPYPPYPPEPRRDPVPDSVPDPNNGTDPDDYRIGEHDRKVDPLVEKAAQELRTAWLNGDIELLSKHIRRDVQIEVYVDRKLQQTLDASDFLSDARYAFDTKTVAFQIDSIVPITRTVYKVVARRTTRDLLGAENTVVLRYVLKKMDGSYIITRIDNED